MTDHRETQGTRRRAKEQRPSQPEQELLRIRQECEEYRAGWQRCQADFANLQRRSEEEHLRIRERAELATLLKLTPLIDDFRRALAHVPAPSQETAWVTGLKQIEKSLRRLLSDAGFTEIPVTGPFDPKLHEAIAHEDHPHVPEDMIIDALQTGWQVNNNVVKPAQVRVSRGNVKREGRPHE